jgi:phenylpropionate dioxygenase-like ring-hydroxylating dioxygenase large terminal subunit
MLDATDHDFEDALIPPERYTSAEFMRLEWEHMWRRTWLLAGRVADLSRVGDFFTFEIGHESLIVVRGVDDAIRAMYNVCSHRGTRIVSRSRGNCAHLTCPYHAWEYHLDGRIRRITDPSLASLGAGPEALRLPTVRCETWAGFVWVCLGESAPPLHQYLGSIAHQLEPYLPDQHALVRDVTVEWDCNWKVCIDNSNETYHVRAIHPQLLEVLDDEDIRPEIRGDHSCFRVRFGVPSRRFPHGDEIPDGLRKLMEKAGVNPSTFRGRRGDVRDALKAAARARYAADGIDYPGLSDDELVDNFHVHVFPNVMFNFLLPGFWIFRARPHATDPNKMWFDFQEYERFPASREPQVRPEHRVVRAGEVALDTVLDQDAAIVPEVQRGMRSAACRPLRFAAQERRLLHMQETLERYIFGRAGAGRARGQAVTGRD